MSEPASEPDLRPPVTLLLIRHARTASTGRDVTGGGDEVPLDEEGQEQADQLVGADHDALDAILTSPTERTRMTAAALASVVRIPVLEAPEWRETPSTSEEDLEALLARVTRARDAVLAASGPGTVVAVVTHAGPIKALLAVELGASRALWRLRIDPASITTVRYWADGGCEVSAVNDTGHLRYT